MGWLYYIIGGIIGLIVIWIIIRKVTKDKVIYAGSNQPSGFKRLFSKSCDKPC